MFITDGNIELFKGIGRDGMMGEGEPLYEMVVCDWGMQLKTSTEPIPAFSIYSYNPLSFSLIPSFPPSFLYPPYTSLPLHFFTLTLVYSRLLL